MNLLSLLVRRATEQPARLVYAFEAEDGVEESLTHAQLASRDRKSTRLNSSHNPASRMPSSA
jgi:hypothetical protein